MPAAGILLSSDEDEMVPSVVELGKGRSTTPTDPSDSLKPSLSAAPGNAGNALPPSQSKVYQQYLVFAILYFVVRRDIFSFEYDLSDSVLI